MSRKKVTPAKIEQAERDALCVTLRGKGLTLEQIAKSVLKDGVPYYKTPAGVSKAIDRALAQIPAESVEKLREVQSRQMGNVIRNASDIQTKAMNENNPELALKASDRIIRAADRLAKLYGMDAPVRTDVTSDGEPLTIVVNRDWDPEVAP